MRSLLPALVALLVLTAPLAGCQFLDDGSSLATYRSDLARLDAQIVAAIGQARAEDAASCQAITYGSKACGGPTRARVYSLADGNPSRVVELAGRYTALEAEMNQRFNLASDCAYLMTPTAVLESGQCVAGPPSHD